MGKNLKTQIWALKYGTMSSYLTHIYQKTIQANYILLKKFYQEELVKIKNKDYSS